MTINEISHKLFNLKCIVCESKIIKNINTDIRFAFKCENCYDFEMYGYQSSISEAIHVRFNDFKNKLNFSYLYNLQYCDLNIIYNKNTEQIIVDKIKFNNYNDFVHSIINFPNTYFKYKKLLILL